LLPETNDLIYEGIATSKVAGLLASVDETNDLIYEGIATQTYCLRDNNSGKYRNKRPDLRRDCDHNATSRCPPSYWETNDLIYEGIATRSFKAFFASHLGETNDLIYEGIATTGGLRFCAPQL